MRWWPLLAAPAALVLLMPRKALGYVKGKPVDLEVDSIGNGQLLRADAAAAFKAMQLAAAADGVELVPNSGWRSMESQTRLYELWKTGKGNQAAQPGYSLHQGGVAVDIDVDGSFGSATYRWLKSNAHRFGFDNATGLNINEPWHWEFSA